ncbi:hypothetical protein H8F27_00500 [Synechococcus sp. CBW1108]|nr:hypothetical protein H8F27_00500 [Synechococcus sp. CBW1108]
MPSAKLAFWPVEGSQVDAAARGEAQKVTRLGKWVSVVLSAEDYQRLQHLEVANAPSLNELQPPDLPS